MNLDAAIVARLGEISPATFSTVGLAADFAAIERNMPTTPAAFVLIKSEVSAPTDRVTGLVLQVCQVDVAVVIVTENVADPLGAAASTDMTDLKRAVRKALIGWMPACAEQPIEHVSGELLKARNGVIWHEDVFSTAVYLEEEPS